MTDTVENLIRSAAEHTTADAYRRLWGTARAFSDLPVVSRADLFAGPLANRRYRAPLSFTKIVRSGAGAILSEWAYEDIAREAYGEPSARPMVYFSDAHEGIEKSMWCYERDMVPLLGETHNPAVAAALARMYRVDSIIADAPSLERLRTYIENRDERLACISVLGSRFDAKELQWARELTKRLRLVLHVPETGAFAEAAHDSEPVFVPHEGCIIERGKNSLILTREASLITPIIRYDTGIPNDSVRMSNDTPPRTSE